MNQPSNYPRLVEVLRLAEDILLGRAVAEPEQVEHRLHRLNEQLLAPGGGETDYPGIAMLAQALRFAVAARIDGNRDDATIWAQAAGALTPLVARYRREAVHG